MTALPPESSSTRQCFPLASLAPIPEHACAVPPGPANQAQLTAYKNPMDRL